MTSSDHPTIAVIGECMLELNLASQPDSNRTPAVLAYGGDTLNTSIYLSRLNAKVDYVTALGDDLMSDWMVSQWQAENVGCSLVYREPKSVPGLYMINVDDEGERSFNYWRANSPASKLFDGAKSVALFSTLEGYDYLYLSGISVAILKPEIRTKLIEFLTQYKSKGGKVIFDGNYRPNLWQSTEEAMHCYKALYSITDIALPTLEDEQILFAHENAQATLDAILSYGATEVVLKMGEDGCLYSKDNKIGFVPTKKVSVVDTTSAGDSFNAGYLSARLKGLPVVASCESGHILASNVIQHRGAVIPKSAMPSMDLCEQVVEGCEEDVTKALNCNSLN